MRVSEALNNKFIAETIEKILKKGNTVELKREKDNLVVVEIDRTAKLKTSLQLGNDKKEN